MFGISTRIDASYWILDPSFLSLTFEYWVLNTDFIYSENINAFAAKANPSMGIFIYGLAILWRNCPVSKFEV